MIASTVLAATLTAAQPQPSPMPAMDHGKTAPIKIEIGAAGHRGAAAAANMDCCKDGCTCCAKGKVKPAS